MELSHDVGRLTEKTDQLRQDVRDQVSKAEVQHMRDLLAEFKTEIRDIRNEQRTDFRVTFGAIIAVAIGLAGLMAHGFKWI